MPSHLEILQSNLLNQLMFKTFIKIILNQSVHVNIDFEKIIVQTNINECNEQWFCILTVTAIDE